LNGGYQTGQLRLRSGSVTEQVIHQEGIGQFEEPGEQLTLVCRGFGQAQADITLQEHVEFLHAAATPPLQAAGFLIQPAGL
jgi:hypothetical protein